MTLSDRVHIARRFQRSVRIDTDLDDANALDGFICPKSSADVLRAMARHISETGQGAFTWTGPYGSGKSSLVVVLSALLSGKRHVQGKARKAIGPDIAKEIKSALGPRTKGWHVLPVVGRRDHPERVIGEAIEHASFWKGSPPEVWTESKVLEEVKALANKTPKTSGGLIVFLDEMGKFLEAATRESSDVYLFQQLAELASRSNGRLIVVGILHQAFEEYAHRLSREMRDEWSKIQGRFVDLPVNVAGEEQLELIARAIESDHLPSEPGKLAKSVASVISAARPGVSKNIATALENCWPLHPIVAALLGPISRRRFGQNQRSIFGFLNSSEPGGFQDFIRHASTDDIYGPERLWDYLRLNLEPSILVSPDGHRWSIAFEAIERCEGLGGDPLQLRLLKTIALVDLFKDRSGLIANSDLLKIAAPDATNRAIKAAIKQLEDWSLIIYRKFASSFAVFAGSDFDIESALVRALEDAQDIDFKNLHNLSGLQPILAKRHYHRTGALRWFDVVISPLEELGTLIDEYTPSSGSIGQFVITLPTSGETEEFALETCREAAHKAGNWYSIIGLSTRSWAITELAKELSALETVWSTSSILSGDSVARKELHARIAATQARLEEELQQALENALWFRKGAEELRMNRDELTQLASRLADEKFPKAPLLTTELLNRVKPSSSAVAAQKSLLRQMVLHDGEERLGIEGFPAEGGLYTSLLEASGLHQKIKKQWQLAAPAPDKDRLGILPLWEAADKFLDANGSRSVAASEIYALWSAPPFGLKNGLLPILLVAYILSQKEKIAFYRQGIFQAVITDLDVDYLTKDPSHIQLRWMDLSELTRRLLSDMADLVREFDGEKALQNLEPIDVARGLIAIYDRMPSWTKRTMQLSQNALEIRRLFKQAIDPNKFLFDDIPELLEGAEPECKDDLFIEITKRVREGLNELQDAYPMMLQKLRNTLLCELQVPNSSDTAIAELRDRAENVQELTGDFRLEAFISRLTGFDGSDQAMEGIASLAVNKPPRDWVDPDINRATINLAELAQNFVRIEAFAHIKGRTDKRHAMAVVVGIDGQPKTFRGEFSITDEDRKSVDDLLAEVDAALIAADDHQKNVLLGAMAELIARHLANSEKIETQIRTEVAS